MSQEDEIHIQALVKLGLTLLQATIYVTLENLDKAGILRISKTSNVARPEVYRVIPALEKKGLVEKIVSNPAMYKAVPLKQGFTMLLQRKNEENEALQQQIKSLVSNIHEKSKEQINETEDSQFVITTEKKLFFKRYEQAILESQKSADFVFTSGAFSNTLYSLLHQFKAVMARGVRLRMVAEKAEYKQSVLQKVEELKKNSLFEVKFTSEHALVCMIITDKKILNTQISEGAVPSLLSNNVQVLKIAMTYFETLWSKAEENPDEPEAKKEDIGTKQKK